MLTLNMYGLAYLGDRYKYFEISLPKYIYSLSDFDYYNGARFIFFFIDQSLNSCKPETFRRSQSYFLNLFQPLGHNKG